MTQKWLHQYEIKPGRWVFAPTKESRKNGIRIRRAVATRWKAPGFYFHLRTGGHVAAVRVHTANKFFFRVDLDNFFGRVNRSRVTRCLKSWFPYVEAREMASESVVKNPSSGEFVLPYGFVQSPILASLALDLSKLGSFLRSLYESGGLTVSVYVDDIIVSGNDDALLTTVATDLVATAERARFPVQASKTEGPGSSITAFNIEISNSTMRITDQRMARFKEAYDAASSSFAVAGISSYVRSVNPTQLADL